MRALDRKVVRDLWHMRGQVLAIAIVIASGVAVLVMALSTQHALLQTAQAYYERYAFADAFAGLTRAPERLALRIGAVPGVQTVQTRIMRYAMLDIEDFAEPVLGQFVSVPEDRQPVLNQLVLRTGRSVAPNRNDEVILNEPFAEAHGIGVGDVVVATLNGHRRNLRVVGIALSPEFIYALGPGALMPDDERFGILWMGRDALAAAFDLQGAFNNVSLRLARGAQLEAVIHELDRLLKPYGGVGAIGRKDHLSNWFVMNEIDQLEKMSRILPAIFLIVSAFLTNMVLARLVATERSQIGLMKAFGYSNLEVGWHYAKLVLVITSVGIGIGLIAGAYAGRLNTELYAGLFRFPLLLYRLDPASLTIAAGVTFFAALAGTIGVVRRAALLPPAQAMIPPTPPSYRKSWLARTRFGQWLDEPSRIIVRHIVREPLRAMLTCGGVAAAVGLLVVALQWEDAFEYLAQRYFFDAQRQHVMVGLAEPQASNIVHDFEHLPAVLAVEPMRFVSADLQAGPITHRGAITGIQSGAELQPIFDELNDRVIEPPEHGVVLATRLAKKLEVDIGDTIWVKVLEGRRPEVELPIVATMGTHIGTPAFMHLDSLNRLLKERPSAAYVNLLIDPLADAQLYSELKVLPAVSAVMLRQAAIDSFYETLVEHLFVFVTMFAIFAGALGFGVAYNATRIALSERGRELATLRVLGFSRGEISYILLGEVALLIIVGLPLGCLFGYGLAHVIAAAFDTELFRIPLNIEPSTYGWSVIIVAAATVMSAAIVRRRVDRLDLIEVLKTRE